MSTAGRWGFGPIERRRLGLTRQNLIAILTDMDQAGELEEQPNAVIAAECMSHPYKCPAPAGRLFPRGAFSLRSQHISAV